MEEDAFVETVLSDLEFAARVYADLKQRPKAFKQLVAYPKVTRKIVNDPVFFAAFMCGDSWLVKAPDHQKLLRDLSPRQVACAVEVGEKALFSAARTSGFFTQSPKLKASS